MKEIKNMMFTTFLIMNLVLISQCTTGINSMNELEKQIILLEQVSKIEEVKSITKELECAQRKSDVNSSKKQDSPKKPHKEMKINSNVHVTGSITANKFYSEEAKVTGNAHIGKTLKSSDIISDKITAQTLVTDRIISPTGVLTIEGDLIINNDVLADTVSMRGSSFIMEGVRQWGLVHHDDFETEKSLDGWSDKRTSKCKNGGNAFLGGHCNFSFNEVTKVFKNLPEHSKLKINAAFHMIDSWDGEMAYMKVNDEIVWTKKGQFSPDKGLDICGGEHNDPAFNIPVDVTVPHDKSEIKITFGSTLDEEPCNESFGVDDVMIYVR